MRHSFFAAALFFLACDAQAQEPTINAVESLSPKEYLELPEGPQALYVGGASSTGLALPLMVTAYLNMTVMFAASTR